MVMKIATWSLVVPPGKKISHDVLRDVKITNAALGPKLENKTARSTLKVTYEPYIDEDDEPAKGSPKNIKTGISLCSLTPGSIEQASLDITFLEDDLVEFEVVGENSIHLFGNYIDQYHTRNNLDPEEMVFSDEESVDLRDVSSDVEMNADELDGLDDSDDENRFEEIDEKVSTGKKHPRDSDPIDAGASLSGSAKKANKKLKTDSGSGVPLSTDANRESQLEADKDKDKSKKEKKKEKKKKEKGEGKSDAEDAKPSVSKPSVSKPSALKLLQQMTELSGGLKIKDVKPGNGRQAKAGHTVSMRYIGKLSDGTVFDSNTKGKPFVCRLGKGEVIKGWDQGVEGMQVGGERLIVVPPALGYGNKGTSSIPASSTLHFECKMLDIK